MEASLEASLGASLEVSRASAELEKASTTSLKAYDGTRGQPNHQRVWGEKNGGKKRRIMKNGRE